MLYRKIRIGAGGTITIEKSDNPEFQILPNGKIVKTSKKIQAAVQSKQDLPLAPRSRFWDSVGAERRVRQWAGGPNKSNVDFDKYFKAFFWRDQDNQELFTSYKLGYADVIDGKLTAVPRGIFAVAGVLRGARGGVDIPAGDQAKIKKLVKQWYQVMSKEFEDDGIKFEANMSLWAGERLGTILERKRIAMNMTTDELAEKLPIRERAYWMIEYGDNTRPPDDILEAIAKALELDADELKGIADLDWAEPVRYRFEHGYPETVYSD